MSARPLASGAELAADALEHVNCNLCGSSDLRTVYQMPDLRFRTPGLFTVVECRQCGLGFVNPRPRFEEMGQRYPAAFYERFETEDQSARYAREAAYLANVPAARGERSLLDVGCATGGFLRYMKQKGWRVEGIEPFYTENQGDILVHRRQVFDVAGLEGRFDAVTAWAVLEHVHDPRACVRAMSAALKPGGTLVVQVPNFDSLSSRHLYREDVPRHLHFYSRRAMHRLLREHGLQLVTFDCRDNIYEMSAVGFLTWLCYRCVGRPYTHADVPVHYADYCRQRGFKIGAQSLLRYLLAHPLSAADKALAPFVDRVQMMLRSYGQATYVARKVGS